jgi:Ca2+-binding RTX toxin-like protein
MTNYIGTAGNDNLTGTSEGDTFDLTAGGNDNAYGADGYDTFLMGASLDNNDNLDGGAGNDSVVLDGDYTIAIGTNFTSIETLKLLPGHNYNLALDASSSGDATFQVDARELTAGDVFVFRSGGANLDVQGGAGGDDLTVGGNSIVNGRGGNDAILYVGTSDVFGGAGNDSISLRVGWNTSNELIGPTIVDGGNGNDTVYLDARSIGPALHLTVSDVSHSAFLEDYGTTFMHVEDFNITGGNNGNDITLGNGDDVMRHMIGDSVLNGGGGNDLIDQESTASRDELYGGSGDDTLIGGDYQTRLDGGDGDDTIITGYGAHWSGGIDAIFGGNGNDIINSGGIDVIDGGNGFDVLFFSRSGYHTDLSFDETSKSAVTRIVGYGDLDPAGPQTTVVNIEEFHLTGGEGNDMFHTLSGNDTLDGGNGNDVLSAGSGNDTLIGGAGADTLNSGSGHDAFVYHSAKDSTGSLFDTVIGFDSANDHFVLPVAVTGVSSTVAIGSLDAVTFDTDLSAAMTDSTLHKHHAALFQADAGSLSGQTFLVVDANGVPGYQTGEDIVIRMQHNGHLDGLGIANFET